MKFRTDGEYASELDRQDPLGKYRERFYIADPELIYLDGNSLGRLPRASIHLAHDLVERQWGERLIRGWGDGWWEAPERVGAKIARLIGAQPDEVTIADSTSINLFKLATAVLLAQGERTAILTDDLNFPSDVYILQGIVNLLGKRHRLAIIPSEDGIEGPAAAIRSRLKADCALLTLSHTVFKSGFVYDMTSLTAAAHAAGALVLWDLSHSVGSVPVNLGAAGADLAIGCTYKYLNGGPGAPAFLYVRRDLQARLGNPLQGWWGQNQPFAFDLNYIPEPGIRRFQTGTLPMVSLSLIEPGVEMLLEAGMEAVRAKSILQTEYLIALWKELLAPLGYTLNSPRQAAWRGSHVSLGHVEGWRISQCMIREMQLIPDFRAPDNIRLGISPLYTSFSEIHTAVVRMQRIVQERLYKNYPGELTAVT